jgi:putative iron-dependent peroxidase
LILHIRAARTDVCFELATLIQTALADACTVIDEVHGFRYFDQRDLLGFVDGTENPDGPDVADTILVGDEDREFAGGAYLLVQKYLHNMRGWEQLTVEEQENVVGRTKLSNVELPEDRMPPNSHVSLTSIETDDGTELQIVRDNVAFGSHARGEFGTYFIGYSRSPAVSERMLRNMFLGDPLGNVDRILDFSTPVSGIQFFIPSRDFLNNLPPLPGPTAVELAQGR